MLISDQDNLCHVKITPLKICIIRYNYSIYCGVLGNTGARGWGVGGIPDWRAGGWGPGADGVLGQVSGCAGGWVEDR